MAEVSIDFETDNAAFEEDFEGEAADLVSHVAKQLREGFREGPLMDSNGNRVGYWRS